MASLLTVGHTEQLVGKREPAKVLEVLGHQGRPQRLRRVGSFEVAQDRPRLLQVAGQVVI